MSDEGFAEDEKASGRHEPSVFAYWTGGPDEVLHNFTQEWRSAFPSFHVFKDDEVRPLIEKYFPDFTEVYDSIAIPAAKSDIARLVLLHEKGGLYVDCHCGVADRSGIEAALELLLDYEAVLIDKSWAKKKRAVDQLVFINTILFFRKRSPLTYMLARRALANFDAIRDFERRFGWGPYNILSLSGPGLLTSTILQPLENSIREDFRDRIHIIREEVSPVVRDRHRTYGGPGLHWSQRQKSERLFITPDNKGFGSQDPAPAGRAGRKGPE